MAWTINVAVLCVVVSIIVAKKKYESPLQVFQEPKDIESLFEDGKTYYVEAGTIKRGPEQFPRYYLYCGEVLVKRNKSTTIIKRRYLYPTRGTWSWLEANYKVIIETDTTGIKPRKYADIRSMHGMHTRVATLYLLWLVNNTCALFYNNHTDDCEAWVFEKPPLKLFEQSVCSTLTLVCKKRSYLHYVSECYQSH
uniref:Putative salivary lipocalin n=1 Tax=Ixodes ricinus TaxID=34613 RepID=A0A6B0V0J1_IXORI